MHYVFNILSYFKLKLFQRASVLIISLDILYRSGYSEQVIVYILSDFPGRQFIL